MPDNKQRISIQRYNPWRIWIVAGVMLIAGLIASGITYYIGLDRGLHDESLITNRVNTLEQNIKLLDKRNRELGEETVAQKNKVKEAQQKVTELRREKEIDRVALATVSQDLIQQSQTIGELNEKLAFYKAILSPTSDSSGLTIQQFKVFKTDKNNWFNYELTLVQALRHDKPIKGAVNFTVEGVQDGQVKIIKLDSISRPKISNHAYNFRYYEKFLGNIELPEGFAPVRVKVSAKPKGRSSKAVTSSYSWNTNPVVNSNNDISVVNTTE